MLCHYIKGQETLKPILAIYFSVLTQVQDTSIYSLLCNQKGAESKAPPPHTHTLWVQIEPLSVVIRKSLVM